MLRNNDVAYEFLEQIIPKKMADCRGFAPHPHAGTNSLAPRPSALGWLTIQKSPRYRIRTGTERILSSLPLLLG
ncbi:MAG: hypothetical protein JWN25_1934 [Verrucomicrobiales bacterium]|nr:hypothetical protein [Verrucomicrobiales bacterium]